MRKKRKEITRERDNGKREMGNTKLGREDCLGHERREIKEHRRTEKHRNIKTEEQTNKGTEEQVNRGETGEHEKWEWGKCGAKYTTRKKTVRSFTRQLEGPSSRLKILAKMEFITSKWSSSRSINARTPQRLSFTILARGSNERLLEPLYHC